MELDWEMGIFIILLSKEFEKYNHMSSTSPKSGASENRFALLEMTKKKRTGTTKNIIITTKIGV